MNRDQLKTDLKALRDEIKVQIHLGTLELKQRWEALEPRMYEAEKYLNEVGEAGTAAIDEVVKRARDLREQLKQTRQGYKKVGPHAH